MRCFQPKRRRRQSPRHNAARLRGLPPSRALSSLSCLFMMPPRNRPTAWEVSTGDSNAHVSLNTSNNASPFSRLAPRPPAPSTSTHTPSDSSYRAYSPASSVGGSTLVGNPRDAQRGKRRYDEWGEGTNGKGKRVSVRFYLRIALV